MDFTAPCDFGDVTFIVEEKELYASKAVLALSSEVFRVMFTSEFKEKKMTEIPLPDKKFADFLQLMQILHPPHRIYIDDTNLESLLPLAHEYQVHHMVENCEKYLLTQHPSIHNLLLADKFSLTKLRKVCMEYTEDIPLNDLDEDQDFKNLESQSLAEVYRRKLDGELSKQVICNVNSQPPSINNLILAQKYHQPDVYEKCMTYLKDTPLSKLQYEAGFRELEPDILNTVLTHKFVTIVEEVGNITDEGRLTQHPACPRASGHSELTVKYCPHCLLYMLKAICKLMEKN